MHILTNFQSNCEIRKVEEFQVFSLFALQWLCIWRIWSLYRTWIHSMKDGPTLGTLMISAETFILPSSVLSGR